MQPEQVTLVQTTWLKVVPNAATAADIFYATLFELDPSLRALFPSDLSEQKKKLMTTIGVVVGSLDRLQNVLPAVRALGERHAGYGVEPAHYDTVARALLYTLKQGLGTDWNQRVEAAWTAAYSTLAKLMIEAAGQRG